MFLKLTKQRSGRRRVNMEHVKYYEAHETNGTWIEFNSETEAGFSVLEVPEAIDAAIMGNINSVMLRNPSTEIEDS